MDHFVYLYPISSGVCRQELVGSNVSVYPRSLVVVVIILVRLPYAGPSQYFVQGYSIAQKKLVNALQNPASNSGLNRKKMSDFGCLNYDCICQIGKGKVQFIVFASYYSLY